MNGQFQIAVHILTLLSKSEHELVSSDYIAGSLNVNPALARKEISNLRKLGLIESKEGKNGGYSLAKPASLITLADAYQAVKSHPVLGVAKNTPNPNCPVGKLVQKSIERLYTDLDETLMAKLNTITVADFSNQFD
jgi:Rrf2 family protein